MHKVISVSHPTIFRLFLLIGLFSFIQTPLLAQTTSTGTGNWEDVSWSNGLPVKGGNATITDGKVIIPKGKTYEVQNLTIDALGDLEVHGNLIVYGKLMMTNTSEGFSMGVDAAVIIFGDFEIKNQVEISLSSLLVVYGNFTKNGSVTQGDLTINEGNIYVFGEVAGNGWPTDFGCTEEYSGSTPDVSETCDYGNETDFEENRDIVPDELIDYINCFDVSISQNEQVCLGETATFSVAAEPDVTYQWQIKENDGNWLPIPDATGVTLNVVDTKPEMANNLYRVIASPNETAVNCTSSVSVPVSINFISTYSWIGITGTDWNDADNWSCKRIPDSTMDVIIPSGLPYYPIISENNSGAVKNLAVDPGANIIVDGSLAIFGNVTANNNINAQNGTVIFNGNADQVLPANIFFENKMEDLVVRNSDNSHSLTLEGELLIIGTVTAENGDIFSNGNLTLLSDENQTALISGTGNGQVIGAVTMQRYLDSAFGYKYFSSPFSNSTVFDFVPYIDLIDPETDFPHFYRYNENREYTLEDELYDLTGWEAYLDLTDPLNQMEGYAINFGDAVLPVTISLSGEVTNGTVTREFVTQNGTFTEGYHLVGNPYPSPIDWDLLDLSGTNIDNAIHFFTAGNEDQYTGTYASYINGISSADGKSSNIIPSMQGFFVHVSEGATIGTLVFDNIIRVDDFSQEFLKTSSRKEKPTIRISAKFENTKVKDPTVIYFNRFATASFEENLDALKLMNTQSDVPNFYSLTSEKEELSINALPEIPANDLLRIPLGIELKRSGNIIIQLQENENLSAGQYVYLVDLEKNMSQNLNRNGKYTIFLDKGTHEKRFELVLSNSPVTDQDIILDKPFSVRYDKGALQVDLNLSIGQEAELVVSTINGQILASRKGTGKETVKIFGIKSSGVYIINIRTENSSYSKKVLIQI